MPRAGIVDFMKSKFLAEFIGTFTLVFAGVGSVMVAERFPGSVNAGTVPIVFGLAVAVMIYAVGHISGAHFNPAVTAAFTVARHFPVKQVIPYWFAQFAGAVLAAVILRFTLPEGQNVGVTAWHVPVGSAFLWEIVLTFFLMFVIVSVATDTRAVGMMAGLAIGGTVTMGAYIGGPVTGASMNPARSFAPALMAGQFENLWLYFVAPLIGAILAAYVYEKIRCEAKMPEGPIDTSERAQKDAKGCC